MKLKKIIKATYIKNKWWYVLLECGHTIKRNFAWYKKTEGELIEKTRLVVVMSVTKIVAKMLYNGSSISRPICGSSLMR